MHAEPGKRHLVVRDNNEENRTATPLALFGASLVILFTSLPQALIAFGHEKVLRRS